MKQFTWTVRPYDGYESDNFDVKITAKDEESSGYILEDLGLGYPQFIKKVTDI